MYTFIMFGGLLLVILFMQHGYSSQHCDNDKNEYSAYSNGVCPTGTVWDDEKGCCVGCPLCGPGWMKSPGCKGPCLPCPGGTYSTEQDNYRCFNCTKCEDLHREYVHECLPAGNAECGNCMLGYFIHEEYEEYKKIPCLKCLAADQHYKCQQYFTTPPPTPSWTTTSTSKDIPGFVKSRVEQNNDEKVDRQVYGDDPSEDGLSHVSVAVITLSVIVVLFTMAGLVHNYRGRIMFRINRFYVRLFGKRKYGTSWSRALKVSFYEEKDQWHNDELEENKTTILELVHVSDNLLTRVIECNLLAVQTVDRMRGSTKQELAEWFFRLLQTKSSDIYLMIRECLKHDGQTELYNLLPGGPACEAIAQIHEDHERAKLLRRSYQHGNSKENKFWHLSVLINQRSEIADMIRIDDQFIRRLTGRQVITEQTGRKILECETHEEQVSWLLEIIILRKPDDYLRFRDCLKSDNQDDLYNVLPEREGMHIY